MRHVAMAALTAAVGFGATMAGAATLDILPQGETSVEVTADLGALGLAGAPIGSATVSVPDANPVFAFPITGGSVDSAGAALIEHDGSGVELSAIADPTISASVGDFAIDTAAGNVAGSVNGSVAMPVLFDFGTISDAGIQLTISDDLAGALTSVFGAPDLSGAEFGIANTAPQTAPGGAAVIPVPAALPLMLAGLGALALLRRRQGGAATAF